MDGADRPVWYAERTRQRDDVGSALCEPSQKWPRLSLREASLTAGYSMHKKGNQGLELLEKAEVDMGKENSKAGNSQVFPSSLQAELIPLFVHHEVSQPKNMAAVDGLDSFLLPLHERQASFSPPSLTMA